MVGATMADEEGPKRSAWFARSFFFAHERRYKTNVCHHACGLAKLAADRQVKQEAGGKEKLKKLKKQDPERYSMIVVACNSEGKKKDAVDADGLQESGEVLGQDEWLATKESAYIVG